MTSTTHKPASDMTFAEVVEQLEGALPAAAAEYGPGCAIASGAAAQPMPEPAYVSSNALSQIYETTTSSFGPSRPVAPVAVAAEVAAPSVKPQDIARELKLRVWHSPGQILEIRRRFALKNHPDRVAASVRDAATTRMSIANTLVDEALKARDTRA